MHHILLLTRALFLGLFLFVFPQKHHKQLVAAYFTEKSIEIDCPVHLLCLNKA